MTPSPTSEPDLELATEPVAKTDAPETADTAAGTTAPDEANATTESQPGDTTGTTGAETVPVVSETVSADHTTDPGTDPEAAGSETADLEDGPPYPPTEPGHYPTLVPLVGSLVALVALVAVLFGAFALPALHAGPNHLPIGAAGPAAITKQIVTVFGQVDPKSKDHYQFTQYTSEAQLRKAIKERKIYGGLFVSEGGTTAKMLVSTAASAVATQELAGIANSIGNGQIQVTDVVALPKKDPQAFALNSLAWPLVIASLLPALLMFRLYRRRATAQLGGTVAASVLLGLALSALLKFWLDLTPGADYWALTGALAAGVAATSLIVLGIGAIVGRVGVIVASAAVVLISAPLAGFTTAPQWLPSPWDTIGQLLPVGAAGTVLRSTAFFHAHGAGTALIVLGAWALIGLVFLLLGAALLPPKEEIVLSEADLIELELPDTQPAAG